MNTEQLKYFMEFAFYGTAEKTAAQLGVSRSSVSRNIKKLEEELGSKLFTAGVQGIVLTREGDLCLKYARKILKIEDDLRFDVAGAEQYRYCNGSQPFQGYVVICASGIQPEIP